MRRKHISNVIENGHSTRCLICGKIKPAIIVEVSLEDGKVINLCNLDACKICFWKSCFLRSQFCIGQGISD
ncbi:MAG: hypothetical protein WCV59_03255 [Parcubacteria group bacterium]|jgi:hypothetical protein